MNKLTRRIVGIVILVALVALPIIFLNRLGLDEETIRAYVERMGIWAPLGLFTLRFTSVVIPALPSEAYSVLAGGLLGFGQGLIVVCLSDLLSCTLSFWLASTYGRGGVQKLVGDRFMYQVDRFAQKHLEQNFFLMEPLGVSFYPLWFSALPSPIPPLLHWEQGFWQEGGRYF